MSTISLRFLPTIGARLKTLMEREGLSRNHVSLRIMKEMNLPYFSSTNIASWVTDRKAPSARYIQCLCNMFNVKVSWFLGEEGRDMREPVFSPLEKNRVYVPQTPKPEDLFETIEVLEETFESLSKWFKINPLGTTADQELNLILNSRHNVEVAIHRLQRTAELAAWVNKKEKQKEEAHG